VKIITILIFKMVNMPRLFQKDINNMKKLIKIFPNDIVNLICEFMNPFLVMQLIDIGMFGPKDIRFRFIREYNIYVIDWILIRDLNIIELEICDSFAGSGDKTLCEIANLPNLEKLTIKGLNCKTIIKFPQKLKTLELVNMYNLTHIPEFPPNIEIIVLENLWKCSNVPKLPNSVRSFFSMDSPVPKEHSLKIFKLVK
jgi:hypothetical protein